MLFTCFLSYSQCDCKNAAVNLQLEQVRYYTFIEDFKKVDSIHNILEDNKTSRNLDFQEASLAIMQDKYDEAREGFIKYLNNGGTIGAVLNKLQDSPDFTQRDSLFLVENEKSFFLEYLKNYDYKLILELNELYAVDQYFNIWKNKVLEDRAEQHAIRKKIFRQNLIKLKEFVISNDGKLPQFEQVGFGTKPVILAIMHHTRNDSIDEQNFQFFEEVLRDEICNRFTYIPNTYVHLIDNMQLVFEKDHKQVYGEHINSREKQIYPLKYPAKVDSLRASIGLLPLKLHAEINNVSLPENYSYGSDSN
jgi:hypothetical protein